MKSIMEHEEWIKFIWDNKDRFMIQLHALLPDREFTGIDPGIYPILYLKRRHGKIELNYEAVRIELDAERKIQKAKIINPRNEDDEQRF